MVRRWQQEKKRIHCNLSIASFIIAIRSNELLYLEIGKGSNMIAKFLHSFGRWCIPPLSERKPHTIFSFLLLILTLCLPTVAAYIRLYHPSLSFKWRALYTLSLVPIAFRSCFLHYTHWNAIGEPSSIYGNGDAYMGACALSIIIFTMDFLFLAKNEEQNVKDADGYRQWLQERLADTDSSAVIKKEEEKVTGGERYTLERPKYFPGTNAWLPFDIAMSPRAFGYIRGLPQIGAPFQAGYGALIASERLKSRSKIVEREASLLKLDNTLFVGWQCLQTFLMSDLLMAVLGHSAFIGIQKHIKDNNGFMSLSESTQSSTFGPTLTTWIASLLVGASMPLRMQMIHLFVYFFTLLFTSPHGIPITVSRYEPTLSPNFAFCTSLRSLWSQGWHQLPRRQYTVIAMRPFAKLAKTLSLPKSIGRMFGLLFAFFLSGISHELSLEGLLAHIPNVSTKYRKGVNESQLRAMGFGFGAKNFISTKFFLTQAIIIIFEEFWTNHIEPFWANLIFGKNQDRLIDGKLRNVIGWIWCTICITWPGIAMVDVWSAHGIMCPITPSIVFTPLFNLIF